MAHVLIVDDEDAVVDLLAELVEDLGYQPLTASNGRDALEVLAAYGEVPALVLSDIMMPRMSGVELVQRLHADPRYQQVPMILMSAADPPRDATLHAHFMHKPFDINALALLIEHYVAGHDAEQS